MSAVVQSGGRATKGPRIEWIQQLRGFLALYVVMHHAVLNIDHSGSHDALWDVLDAVFGWGHLRVDVFFVLSAFCLGLPLFDARRVANFKSFLQRRCARLLPAYYVTCLLSFALAAWVIDKSTQTHWDVSLPVNLPGLTTHLLLIHQWWPQYAVQGNHPLWSIGAEFQLCLLLPVLAWSCRRMGPWNSMALATAMGYLTWRATVAVGFPDPSPWGASVYYLSLFGLGVGAAYVFQHPERPIWPRGKELTAIAGVAALMVAWVVAQELRNHWVSLQIASFFVGLATAGLLMFSRNERYRHRVVRGVGGRLLSHLGERSYSLYLIHAPVLQLVWQYVVRPMHMHSAGLQALATLVLGALASWVSGCALFRLVEMPSIRWSHGFRAEAAHASPVSFKAADARGSA